MFVFVLASVIASLLALWLWLRLRQAQRAEFIRTRPLPKGLYALLRQRHPQLTDRDCALVGQALRQFFLAWLCSGFRPIAMPSRVVDDLWQAFSRDTRAYAAWCDGAFGRHLEHQPVTALSPADPGRNEGLRRCWWQCCRAENIDPRAPKRLPLLFAIDRKLGIAAGHFYVLPPARRQDGGDSGGGGGDTSVSCFSDSSIDGTTDGFGDGGGGNGGGDGGGGE